jgi:hypothetical protein
MLSDKNKNMVLGVTIIAITTLIALPWAVVTGEDNINGEDGFQEGSELWSGLSLEGIWTTMIPTPAGHSSINTFVISAQGSEGTVYTCIGKHPQCSPSGLGLFPEAQRLSDMLGYLVRTGANTFRLSVIYHAVKEGGPERMGIGEIIYMAVLTGTAELIDRDTLLVSDATLAAYTPDQDIDGDRLPDEGAVPVGCFASPLALKRIPMFPSSESTPLPFPESE